MYRIKAKNLVNSTEFIREPVDKEINDILTSDNKKIILSGNTGSGRSVVLRALETRGLGSQEQTILIHPDPIRVLNKEPNDIYVKDVFDYYFGLCFADNLIYYVKSNYPLKYEKYFSAWQNQIHQCLDEFCEELNNGYYREPKFTIHTPGNEIIAKTIDRLYDKLDLRKINLAIDRFDHINGSSEYAQKIYKKYFNMFDKVIITNDDPDIDKEKLLSDGYQIKELTYSQDIEVMRELIRRRLKYMNRECHKQYEDLILSSDYIVNKVISKIADINLTLDIIEEINRILEWNDDNKKFEKLVDRCIDEQIEEQQKVRSRFAKTNLYL